MSEAPRCHLAICRRCRWPERRAAGAATAEELLAHGQALVEAGESVCRVRLSQCLHSCDGGHTVRIESGGHELALVGVRTTGELGEVLSELDVLLAGQAGSRWRKRVYQEWRDGRMVYHRGLGLGGDP